MENNQEHKIDKIFRETFENQEIIPPLDAWMGIHTYTIGQEEKKPKVWLQYASLALLILVFFGFGVWYFIDNQIVVDKNSSKLISQKVLIEDNKYVEKKGKSSVRIQTTARVISENNTYSKKDGKSSVRTQTTAQSIKFSEKMFSRDIFSKNQKGQTQLLGNEIVDDSLMNKNTEYVETNSFSKENEISEIDYKPLIINNLSEKVIYNNERKIVVLDKVLEEKKIIYKPDSMVFGKGFSLKYPIIDMSLLSSYNSFWRTSGNVPQNTISPNDDNKHSYFRIGLSWKVNKKIRTGLSFTFLNSTYDLPTNNGQSKGSTFFLESNNNGNDYYSVKTIYGNIQIPTGEIKFADPNLQNGALSYFTFDANPPSGYPSKEFYSDPHFYVKSYQIGVNTEYDIFSKDWISKKNNGYQIYVKGEINLQLIRKNGFITAFGELQNNSEKKYYSYFKNLESMENNTEKIFAGRVGLGARWLVARRVDFYAEGFAQRNINSWVKDLSFDTYQNVVGYQFGFHINL